MSEEENRYREVGLDILSEGTTALVLLAGGQASRLQISAVKGDIDIGLPSRVLVFVGSSDRQNALSTHLQSHQVHSEQGGGAIGKSSSAPRLRHDLRVQHPRHAGQYPHFRARFFLHPLFARNDYYGLEKSQITFFQQGSFPCVDSDGDFIMQEKHKVFAFPSCHVDRSLPRRKRRPLLCSSSLACHRRLASQGHQANSRVRHRQHL